MNKDAIMLLLGNRPIAYHPILARVCGGVESAVFLGQLLYWTGKQRNPAGWIYKTQAEMEEETSLTRSNQVTARRKLKKLGVIEERLAGVPATLHFRVNLETLGEILNDYNQQTSLQESCKLDSRNHANKKAETMQTNTETTPETTTENTPSCATGAAQPPLSPEMAPPPIPEKKPKPKKSPPPPGAKVFHSVTRKWPPRAFYGDIDSRVGRESVDLTFWGTVVKAYVGLGWNPRNVTGMLDFFQRREVPCVNGGKSTNAAQEAPAMAAVRAYAESRGVL